MTAFTLKIIALSAMLIDHMGAVFPELFPFWFRAVGRLAYPIFVFLLAEGFLHTKSKEKFLMRLLAFALISQIPYAVAMGNSISFIANTNIFYTLFLGGAAVCLYERFKGKYNWHTMAVIAAILPAAILAEILTADYGGFGVMFIFMMYVIKNRAARLTTMGLFALLQLSPLITAFLLGIKIPLKYLLMIPFILATLPLIASYNGERGKNVKWLFYWAYPAHLAVLAVIAVTINGFI